MLRCGDGWIEMMRGYKRKKILFLCRENSGRSIMAEAIMNAYGGGLFRAYSAGLEPGPALPMRVLDILGRHGINTSRLRPKNIGQLREITADDFDFVISTCDRTVGESCPSWIGQPVRAHWNIPTPTCMADPLRFEQELEEMYQLIFRCVNMFLNLPIEAMDMFALSRTLDEIGNKILPDHFKASEPAMALPA